jgi:purine-binding chemotaxis protein CheW
MEMNTMEHQLVVFELSDAFYGIDIAVVESIIKMQAITQLPQTPLYMKGVTNLRGAVLPVIDLRIRFGLETQEDTRQTRIIIVTMDAVKVGLRVDGVSEVLRISEMAIEPLPPMSNSMNSDFLKGIVRLEDRLIILLEVEKVLALEKQQALAQVA